MKLYEIAGNTIQKIDSLSAPELADLIKRECSEFVKAYIKTNGSYLYRGVQDATRDWDYAITRNIRTDRKPVEMPADFHQLINTSMTEMGLQAHRGNSIFCTTNTSTANDWGQPFLIFVADGWAGTVFEEERRDYLYSALYLAAKDITYRGEDEDQAKRSMMHELKKLKPRSFRTNAGLQAVIKSKYNDILITGTKYYGLAVDEYGDFLNHKGLEAIKLIVGDN